MRGWMEVVSFLRVSRSIVREGYVGKGDTKEIDICRKAFVYKLMKLSDFVG